MVEWQRAQEEMARSGIDAWLVHDFRGNNPVLWQLLGARRWTTRRAFLLLPARGEPRLVASAVEGDAFAGMEVEVELYRSWQDYREQVGRALRDGRRVAMEYSPLCQLPILSWVDGGTLELVRSFGVEIVSSADLCQAVLAVWSSQALASHRSACQHVAQVKDQAFEQIRYGLENHTSLTEAGLQQYIREQLEARGLELDHPPIVAVNEHSGNPHYEPGPDLFAPIQHGDWVLVDLWGRLPGEENVYADITWVAWAGRRVPEEKVRVFDAVRQARDRVLERLREAWKAGEPVQGWQLDRVARESIGAAGYGEYFAHRTGHSLGPGPSIHALGANLDDLETRDVRTLLPGTGFTIEPGIYLPGFGVRLEIDVYLDPEGGPEVTTPVQEEIARLV